MVTGRGGLPPTPGEALNPTPGWIDWRVSGSRGDELTRETEEITNHQSPIQDSHSQIPDPLVEATGWVKDIDGTVRLVAAPSLTVSSNKYFPQNCRANSFPINK